MNLVYKVCSKNDWNHAILNKFYAGSQKVDEDTLIHLSIKKQLNKILTKHFRGEKKT